MTEACVELGAANVTVSSVVERSGVSRRTFYELFDSCEGCLVAALDDALDCASKQVVAAYRSKGRWKEQIRAGLVALLAFLEQEPSMGRLLVVESLAAGSGTRRRRQAAFARVVDAVDEGRKAGPARGARPVAIAAEGIAGGVLSVIQSRILDLDGRSLLELTGPLMSIIVLPYLGAAAAQRELARRVVVPIGDPSSDAGNPLRDIDMRLTYRTVCVLGSVAGKPGSSNREVGLAAGITDQGQISKLLTRLAKLGLVSNDGAGRARGAPNAWVLTGKGLEVHRMVGETQPSAA
jgi:AcrR family transcriptional regulator